MEFSKDISANSLSYSDNSSDDSLNLSERKDEEEAMKENDDSNERKHAEEVANLIRDED